MPEDMTHAPPRIDFVAPEGAGGTQTQETDGTAVQFAVLNRKHAEYDANYWQRCRALYAGGRRMFRDQTLLKQLFPQHRNEPADVYGERLKRAFYISYPGEIVDFIVSGLCAHPIEMMAETEPDEFYEDFFEDVSAPGGRRQTFNQLLRAQILNALICQRSWTQVDFPSTSQLEVDTEAEQEKLGALSAYAFALEPEQVFDWEEDSSGELLWAKVCIETNRRFGFNANPNSVTRTYTIYSRDGWVRYAVTFDKSKPPKPEQMIPVEDVGTHSFMRVPLLRMELPDGLWAMSKLEGMATEFFNKRCALAWAEYKSLFQERHEFLAPPDPLASGPAIADDNSRATSQTHGIGWTQVRYAGDRVEFIGPDSAPFAHAMKSCESIRDEMHRVTYQMALATDVGSAALQQSGESKKENRAAHGVVLTGLGEYVRDHAFDITQTISTGRGDDLEWTASGMSKFDTADKSQTIADAEVLENIDIPSPTFKRRFKYGLSRQMLGDEASEEDLAAIEQELEEAYNVESMLPPPGPMMLPSIDEEDGMDLEELEVADEFTAAPTGQRRGMSSNPRARV